MGMSIEHCTGKVLGQKNTAAAIKSFIEFQFEKCENENIG